MYDWEGRLNARDNNRVVRPLDWGVEWAQNWPCRNGCAQGAPEQVITELNRRILARSDEFFSYRTPSDFRLERVSGPKDHGPTSRDESPPVAGRRPASFLRFTSPVVTPY